jgi:pSer/pThr/pTyr-binding forkhead associated (FHA) protein
MDYQARLVGLSGEYGGSTFLLSKDQVLIGRGEECDLQIVDAHISRNHAQLRHETGGWILEDLGSKHGTFIKGERVARAILADGDTITIGETILRFEAMTSQDAIPTVLESSDETPMVLDNPDLVATQVKSPDDVPTLLDQDAEETARSISPDDVATVMAPAEDQAVPTRASSGGILPPQPPEDTQRSKGLPWKWIAILGGLVAVISVVGLGLVFLGRILDEDIETDSAMVDEQIALTLEAQANAAASQTPLIPATLTPTVESAAPTASEPTSETGDTGDDTLEEPAPAQPMPVLGGASQIAFASDRTGRPQIFLINIDTLEEVQLTDLQGGACQPAWSPDGRTLAYTSPCNTNREEYGGSSVFLMEVDPLGNPGSARPLIVTVGGGDYDPAWSHDGSRIAFTSWRTGRPQIFSVKTDGTDLRNHNDDLAYNWAPTWSNDGSQLAFLTGRGGEEEIWTVPAGGGEERRFSRSDGKDVARPDWSPDGSIIVFEKIVGNIPRLIAAPVADGGVREIQVCQAGSLALQPMGEPNWSPDGGWLAFETWPDGVNHEIAVMQSDCNGYQQLSQDPGLDFDAAWRPSPG